MDLVERGSRGGAGGGRHPQWWSDEPTHGEKWSHVESGGKASVTGAQGFLGRGGRWVKVGDRESRVLRRD